MAGLFEHHDRSRFEVTALSIGPDRASPMRDRIKGAVEHFIDAGEQSDNAIAELVRRREIDIVIDLMGLTRHNGSMSWRSVRRDSGQLSGLFGNHRCRFY